MIRICTEIVKLVKKSKSRSGEEVGYFFKFWLTVE
jgi:hypothetical protein